MNIARRGIALAIGLVLATSMTACSGASPIPDTPTEETRTPAPNSGTGTESLFEGLAGLNDGAVQAEAAEEVPTAQLQPASNYVQGSYTNDTSLTATYWAADWCHYFVATDGVTYGETCVRSAPTANGTASPDHFLVYKFDNTKVENIGPMVLELYTGYAGYTTYRDLTDPVFNTVQWAAFPTGIANLTADNYSVGILDVNGQLVWYTLQQILNMGATARANANVPQATVPSWDPAITVWSYPMISSINNQIANIPSFAG